MPLVLRWLVALLAARRCDAGASPSSRRTTIRDLALGDSDAHGQGDRRRWSRAATPARCALLAGAARRRGARPSATTRSCSSRTARPPTPSTGKAVDAAARRSPTTSSSTTGCAASSTPRIAALQARRRPIAPTRLAAAKELQSGADDDTLPAIAAALAKETDPEIKALLALTQASIQLASTRQGDAPRARSARSRDSDNAQHQDAAAGRARDRRAASSSSPTREVRAEARAVAARGREPACRPATSSARVFTGISLGTHPAAGRARPRDHLRPDGRHQHGARRADHDRRLHDLRRAEPVPRTISPGAFDAYLLAAVPVAFARRRRWSAWCSSAA